jgi:SMC interacting uncharacterized protein involved in chromosome segregation
MSTLAAQHGAADEANRTYADNEIKALKGDLVQRFEKVVEEMDKRHDRTKALVDAMEQRIEAYRESQPDLLSEIGALRKEINQVTLSVDSAKAVAYNAEQLARTQGGMIDSLFEQMNKIRG